MKKRKDIVSIYLMFGLILLVIGFSYAFFIYNKTGLYTHTINGGKMKVIYDEVTGNNITIENAYPRTDEEALTKGLEFEFTITGYNESEKNVYYAIEMDHGTDVSGKTRFLDRDIKLTLYENEEIVLENEIFNNLDNQGIYYGYIEYGTFISTPTINNYMLRVWINDNVYISDTIEDDIDLWDDNDWDWAYSVLDYDEFIQIDEGDVDTLSELGISVYTSDEFANSYANFKVNVRANLTGQDIGMLWYDANGGEYTPKPTSLATNRVTTQKPVMENKGFMGWSTTVDGEVEYYSGDYYSGEGQVLYAVYSNTRNVMGNFSVLNNVAHSISEIHFVNLDINDINEAKNNADSVYDLTYNNQGSVTGLLYGDILYIVSDGTTYLSDVTYQFMGFSKLEYLSFDNVDTSMMIDMDRMFYYCSSLVALDVSSFNTSNVTNMSYMFSFGGRYSTSTLERIIGIENFDTSKVTNMSYMFYNCPGLINLDVSNFDTSNVTDMSYMFEYCSSLTELDVSNFDISNVTNMSYMFYECSSLTTLDVSNFDTSNVTNIWYMFYKCSSLTTLDVSNFDTSNVTNMSYMFYQCSSLTELDVSKFDTSNVTYMSSMFYGCSNLITIYSNSDWNTGKVTASSHMFYGCTKLVGNVSYNSSKIDVKMANPTTGYFTPKSS